MKGYRTLLANTLAMTIPILEVTEWRDVLPEDWLPYYALGLALMNVALRMVTTTPVGRK